MKIEKVSISRTIPTGAYMNDKISMEASLHPGESHETVLDNLSHLINDWHKKANPHLYQTEEDARFNHMTSGQIQPTKVTFTPTPEINIQHKTIDPEDTLALIQNAPSLEVLTTFKLLAGKDKVWYSAYNQRVKELTNG